MMRLTFRSRRTATSTFTASSAGGASGPAWCVFGCFFQLLACFLLLISIFIFSRSSRSTGKSSSRATAKRSRAPQYTTSPTAAKTTCSSSVRPHTYSLFHHPYLPLFAVSPKATDEYRHEELGTWAHELKWQRRALADDPAWYFNRLVLLCALAWLLSLIPGTLDVLATAALALVAVVRWARELLLALPEHARTRSF